MSPFKQLTNNFVGILKNLAMSNLSFLVTLFYIQAASAEVTTQEFVNAQPEPSAIQSCPVEENDSSVGYRCAAGFLGNLRDLVNLPRQFSEFIQGMGRDIQQCHDPEILRGLFFVIEPITDTGILQTADCITMRNMVRNIENQKIREVGVKIDQLRRIEEEISDPTIDPTRREILLNRRDRLTITEAEATFLARYYHREDNLKKFSDSEFLNSLTCMEFKDWMVSICTLTLEAASGTLLRHGLSNFVGNAANVNANKLTLPDNNSLAQHISDHTWNSARLEQMNAAILRAREKLSRNWRHLSRGEQEKRLNEFFREQGVIARNGKRTTLFPSGVSPEDLIEGLANFTLTRVNSKNPSPNSTIYTFDHNGANYQVIVCSSQCRRGDEIFQNGEVLTLFPVCGRGVNQVPAVGRFTRAILDQQELPTIINSIPCS